MVEKRKGGRGPVRERKARTAARGKTKQAKYVLRLYVAGISPRSEQAIRKLKAICDEHLAGRYDLQVIDIYQQPVLARDEQIVAAPTLIKKLPRPLRRLIGGMADEERVLVGLDLKSIEHRGRGGVSG